MEINKVKEKMTDLLSDVFDGATIMVGGFGEAGSPIELLHGLIDHGAKNLTIIANNAGNGNVGLGALIGQKQVKKVICSFPRSPNSLILLAISWVNCEPKSIIKILFKIRSRLIIFWFYICKSL